MRFPLLYKNLLNILLKTSFAKVINMYLFFLYWRKIETYTFRGTLLFVHKNLEV